MPDERDPRMDPSPGDVIVRETCNSITRRVVYNVRGTTIIYRRGEYQGNVCLATWRSWARNAEVVRRSENDGK